MAAVRARACLEGTGHTGVVGEGSLEERISEQGPGGQGVNQVSKSWKSLPGGGISECKGPEANMSLQLEQSKQGKRGTSQLTLWPP